MSRGNATFVTCLTHYWQRVYYESNSDETISSFKSESLTSGMYNTVSSVSYSSFLLSKRI